MNQYLCPDVWTLTLAKRIWTTVTAVWTVLIARTIGRTSGMRSVAICNTICIWSTVHETIDLIVQAILFTDFQQFMITIIYSCIILVNFEVRGRKCIFSVNIDSFPGKNVFQYLKTLIIKIMHWLDSDLIPRLLENFENWKNFMIILLSVKNDSYRRFFGA